MRSFQRNAETGFLESQNTNFQLKRNAFTSDMKVKFLEMAHSVVDRHEYPSVDAICSSLKIAVRTFESHLAVDESFRAEWVALKRRLLTVFTDKLAVKANAKMGTLANLAMLRYLETGSWQQGDGRNQNSTDNVSLKQLSEMKSVIIDGELADNPATSDNLLSNAAPNASIADNQSLSRDDAKK